MIVVLLDGYAFCSDRMTIRFALLCTDAAEIPPQLLKWLKGAILTFPPCSSSLVIHRGVFSLFIF